MFTLYSPVIDAFQAELHQFFTDKNRAAVQAGSPMCSEFLELKHLQPLTSTYNLDKQVLELEVPLARRSLVGNGVEETSEIILELMPLTAAFAAFLKLLQISMTIAVSSTMSERSFSGLKCVKSYVRTSMSDE